MTPQRDRSTRGRCTCPGGTVPVYRAYHEPECPDATAYDKRQWAQDVLSDPVRASIEMSGMSTEDIECVRREFDSPTSDEERAS